MELVGLVAIRGADEAALKLVGVGGAADSAASKLGMLAVGATVLAGAALVGIGVASIKMAGDFQQGVNRLVTGAGDVTDKMRQMGQSILGISTSTGVLTGELLPAMYLIISANQRGAEAENTLAVAARGSVAEQAKVADVANIVSGAMTDYGTKTFNATQYMNGLTRAVQLGKLTLEQLSVSMGPLMPVAHDAGVSFVNLAAAMSTMTNAQIPADRAATSMRFLMQSLEVPTVKANKAFQKFGVDTTDLFNEMKVSVPGALQMIYDAALKAGPYMSKPFVDAVSQMIGGQRSLTAFSALTGSHLATFESNIKAVTDAMNHSKTAVLGWDTAQTNFNVQADRGKAVLAALGISISTQLLPYVTRLVEQIIPLVARFTDWVVQNHVVEKSLLAVGTAISTAVGFILNMIAIGTSVVQFFQQNQLAADALGVAIGMLGGVMALFVASRVADMILSLLEYGLSILTAVAETVTGAAVMTSTFTTMSGMIITSMGAAAASILATLGPFLLAGAVIAAVSIGVVLAIQHWGDISAWLRTAWSNTLNWFNGALSTVGTSVQSVINWFNAWKTPIEIVGGIILTFFAPALIMAGTQAVIAGAKITTSFIVSLVQTGFTSTISAAQISSSFIVSIIATGTQAVISAGKVTVSFIASMLQSGLAAVVSAGQITYAFIASMIRTGVEGWIAAGKLAVYIGSLIATGVQAGVAALPIAGQFVVALIRTGVEAVIAGSKLVVSFVAGLISAAGEASISAATISATIIPALTATGVAATAASTSVATAGAGIVASFGAVALGIMTAGIAGIIGIEAYMLKDATPALIESWKNADFKPPPRYEQSMIEMRNQSHQTSAQVTTDANSMKNNVSNSANQMNKNVQDAFNQMNVKSTAAVQTLSSKAMQILDNLKSSALGDFSTIDQQGISYWNDVADYIANHPINAVINIDENPINSQGPLSGTQLKDYRKNAYASGTDYAPGGPALVGERGAELVLGPQVGYLPRGAQVIPNNKLSGGGSSWSGGGGGDRITVVVPLIINGKEFASATVDDIMEAAARQTRLTHGRRVF